MANTAETFVAITGSQKPYIFDLPQVLSLPSGFEFRFRYRHEWVERKLWERIEKCPESFAGKQLVLLFHSQETRRLIPIRRCVIERVDEFGPVVYIRFRLGDFPKSTLDIRELAAAGSPALKKQSTSWQQATISLTAAGHAADQSLAHFDLSQRLPPGWHFRQVTPTNDVEWEAKPTTGWGALATVLQEEPNLTGVPLFYLLGFEDERQVMTSPSTVRNRFSFRKPNVTGYRLVEGGRYRMRLLAWNGSYPRAAEMRVDCHFDAAVLKLEGAANLVLGRYDVLDFTFLGNKQGYTEVGVSAAPVEPAGKTKEAPHRDRRPLLPRSVTKLQLFLNKILDGASTQPLEPSASEPWKTWPAIYLARIPVRVRGSIPRILITLFFGAGGAGLYLLAPRLFPAGPGQPITSVASALQALGLFMSFVAVSGITEKLIKVREHVLKVGQKPPPALP